MAEDYRQNLSRMSYQVLARKWRPHQFRDVVGQSHVLTALANALDHNRLHHAYLFSGTRGVGKTTIARIFAKGLNCEQGITSTPCGVCATCQEIEQGRFVDLLEIDAASRTKVEDTRDLLDNVQYKPARGRYKVYLIDEVHMLSRHSFNALLKTLEEPPEYVKFLLATTDPQKLPVTILSRCLQFHLKHLDVTQIKDQLSHVLEQESVPAETRALSMIARAAEGSMRDALSLTDQAIALGNGVVQERQVTEMLGTLSTDQAILLLEALAEGHANHVLACLTHLAEVGVEWDGLLKEIASQLHRVAMAQALPESVDGSSPDAERILALGKLVSPQDVQLFYQIALQGRQDLPYAPDGRAGLEMVLLRMLAFRPVTSQQFEPSAVSVPTTQPVPVTTSPQANDRLAMLKAQVEASRTVQQPPTQPTPDVASTPPQEDPQLSSHMAAMEMEAQREVETGYDSFPQQTPSGQAHPAQVTGSQGTISSANSLLAARNMLRSRLRQQEGQSPKKSSAVSAGSDALSVIDRITAKHKPAERASFQAEAKPQVDAGPKDEAYRWTPSLTKAQADRPATVTPDNIKKALQHERTPEMRDKLEKESVELDEWCRIATALDAPRLVKQMALNASMERNGDHIHLCLREEQAHLNTERAQTALVQALSQQLGGGVTLSVTLGQAGTTPLEWRDKLYTEKLAQASQSLKTDPNVRFILQRFSAQLDEESIRPI